MAAGIVFIPIPVLLFFAGIVRLLMHDRCKEKAQAVKASLLVEDGGQQTKRPG